MIDQQSLIDYQQRWQAFTVVETAEGIQHAKQSYQ
jgi:hypothetical protein